MHSVTPIADKPCILTLVPASVHAGFPSPAEDHVGKPLDLNDLRVTHPQAPFMLSVAGDSMVEEGIDDRDIIVVNRAIKPRHGHIVVAILDGEFAVKKLYQRAGRVKLLAGNPTYPPIIPGDGQSLVVWGVVTSSIKRFAI